jgi:hypothetical protein
VYKYRVQINEKIVVVKVMLENAANTTKVKVCALKDQAVETVVDLRAKTTSFVKDTTTKALEAAGKAKTAASAKASSAITFATTTKTGVASTAAVAGGVVCGATGGGAGALAGAAVGVVPAIFTFGLSIPVCATIGLCCGTVAGGSFGVVSGGALGYGGFKHRKELGDIQSKVQSSIGARMTWSHQASTGGSDTPPEQ